MGYVRVVHRLAAVGAAILDRKAGLGQHLADRILEGRAAVVSADGNRDPLRARLRSRARRCRRGCRRAGSRGRVAGESGVDDAAHDLAQIVGRYRPTILVMHC